MAHICKWLCYQLCVRDGPKKGQIHPDTQMFDAIIVWKAEGPKEKAGGMAYEVVLKPAQADTAPRPTSPPKERPLSQEIIDKKLKEAEERRLSLEAERLQRLEKNKARACEAQQKIQEQNDSFSKETEQKLSLKMEAMQEKKNAQINALRTRLQEHAQRVQEVRNASEEYRNMLKEKIDKKMEAHKENRDSQFRSILERLEEHEKHVQEVLEVSNSFSKRTEEKLLTKMEVSLKNRENQLQQLKERLADHERHIQEVQNRRSRIIGGDGDSVEATS